jgi:hypothetical protein
VQLFAVAILLLLTLINWAGLRAGSETQKLASLVKALALLAFVVAGFLFGGHGEFVSPAVQADTTKGAFAILVGGPSSPWSRPGPCAERRGARVDLNRCPSRRCGTTLREFRTGPTYCK